MGKFLLGAVFGVIVLSVLVVGYFLSGRAPVATDAPPMPMEKYLAKKALHAVLDRDMPKTVPIPANEANYLAGAQVYKDNCAVCHGLPGKQMTAIANGMFPKPPELMQGKGVTDDEPGETYWKVAHGIRLTGMPGFQGSLTDTQSWQVSLLLANANKLPESVKALLTAPAGALPPANVKGVL
jgi:mono/diheme cytochrome c family protein